MKETAIQVNQRKIRNGIRKQKEAIQREKEKVWDRLKETGPVTRRLRASWTVDVAKDLESLHGIDVEQELADILISEIAAEQRKDV